MKKVLTVLFILAMSFSALAQDAFVEKFNDYTMMDPINRVQMFVQESPETKAELFKLNLASSTQRFTFNDTQLRILKELYSRLDSKFFIPGTKEYQTTFELEPELSKNFTPKMMRELFTAKGLGGEIEPGSPAIQKINFSPSSCNSGPSISIDPTNSEFFLCYCFYSWSCPEGPDGYYSCTSYYGGCTPDPNGGCGIFGNSTCTGACKWNPQY